MSALDPTTIANLLKQDKERKSAPRTRTQRDRTEPREYATWWSLETHFGGCENPECIDPRETKVTEGAQMVADINGKKSCRRCFLAGWNRTDAS